MQKRPLVRALVEYATSCFVSGSSYSALGCSTRRISLLTENSGMIRSTQAAEKKITASVFPLKQGSTNFQRIDPPSEFPSAQGLALTTDERTLCVAHYQRGIAAIHVESKLTKRLKPAPGIVANGTDGLYCVGLNRVGQSFIAIENGVHSPRITVV